MKRSALLLLTGVLVIGAAWLAARESSDPRFALRLVSVSGNVRAKAADIIAAAALPRGENIWLIDVRAARARVEALPWVRSASIRRSWPNRLSIVVTERVPVARIRLPSAPEDPAAGGEYALVDVAGRVLEVGPEPLDQRLPIVDVRPLPSGATQAGASLAHGDAALALDAARRLSDLHVRYSEIGADPDIGVSALLVSGLRVVFGDTDRLRQKVALAEAIAARIRDPSAVRYVDVRSTNAPTVLYK